MLFAIPVALGVVLGFLLPRRHSVVIEFDRGGAVRVAGVVKSLPASVLLEDDGRLQLVVVNRDTLPHQAGVLAVRQADSLVVDAAACTGQPPGSRSVLLR